MKTASLTINEIKRMVRATGSHWFDPDTMRMFGTQVVGGSVFQGGGGVFFVTSEWDGFRGEEQNKRTYTIRQFDPDTADISTVGEMGGWRSSGDAVNQAKELSGKGEIVSEAFQPVTDDEQFLDDLHAHGLPNATMRQVRSLMRFARRHHRGTEDQCNSGDTEIMLSARSSIKRVCKSLGCGVVFSGDPRGCTVKLVMPDGYTDDFGKEGLCVPMTERGDW